ncbi:MAG TPA: hypothetical protein VF046_03820 [Gemmatimonadales bacterium]
MKLTFLAVGMLAGCVAAAPSPAVRAEREPDCSFRSAATCWTIATRFPERGPEMPDSVTRELLNEAPRIVASAADSTQRP